MEDLSPTQTRILDQAERLFAERGYDGSSLREITEAAEVNLAAVHYHFGSKAQLLAAVLLRRIGPINEERIRRLEALVAEAPQGVPPVDAIVESFLRPAVEQLEGVDSSVLLGLGRMVHEDSDPTRAVFQELFGEVARKYRILEKALPHLDPEEVRSRFHFMIGAMLHSAQVADPDPSDGPPVDGETSLRRLTAFVTAGFEAAPTTYRGESHRETTS